MLGDLTAVLLELLAGLVERLHAGVHLGPRPIEFLGERLALPLERGDLGAGRSAGAPAEQHPDHERHHRRRVERDLRELLRIHGLPSRRQASAGRGRTSVGHWPHRDPTRASERATPRGVIRITRGMPTVRIG